MTTKSSTKNRHSPTKRVEIIRLKMIREASILYEARTIRSPKDSADLFRTFIGDSDRETFCIMCLSTKNEVTAIHTVSIGTLDASLIHPREVFKLPILNNSASIIACHNHPSGHCDPSREDIEVTERLVEAGSLLGIDLLDHIILGNGTFLSMKEKGIIG
jgi:DNA repair protein RadC